jgi:hypothetical protein
VARSIVDAKVEAVIDATLKTENIPGRRGFTRYADLAITVSPRGRAQTSDHHIMYSMVLSAAAAMLDR